MAFAINSTIRSLYLTKPLPKPPLDPKLIFAPRKSTSSLKSSFEIEVVPLPSIDESETSNTSFTHPQHKVCCQCLIDMKHAEVDCFLQLKQ